MVYENSLSKHMRQCFLWNKTNPLCVFGQKFKAPTSNFKIQQPFWLLTQRENVKLTESTDLGNSEGRHVLLLFVLMQCSCFRDISNYVKPFTKAVAEHFLPLSTDTQTHSEVWRMSCVFRCVQLDEYTVSNSCYLAVKPLAVLQRRAASGGRPSHLLAQIIKSTLLVKYSCQGQKLGHITAYQSLISPF